MEWRKKMRDKYTDIFINALMNNNLQELCNIPKSDLHNHFVLDNMK